MYWEYDIVSVDFLVHFFRRCDPRYLLSSMAKLSIPKRIVLSLVIVECIVISAAFAVPELGILLPIERNTQEALAILEKSPTGRNLIQRVRRKTAGNFVVLTSGNTESDNLIDYSNRAVKALTRSEFRYYNALKIPKRVTIYTNRDIVGSSPKEIVKSLAFELENVIHAYSHSHGPFGKDSPRAALTQKLVCNELGLR